MDTADEVVAKLDDEKCWDLLERNELGRVAVNVAGDQDIFPINYVVDRGRVYFRTAPGSKLAGLTANPRVAFEVDEFDDTVAASVVVKGTASRVELQSAIDVLDALPLRPWIPTLKYRWVKITPDTLTGRRFHRAPEPDRYVASADDQWT